MSGLEALAPWIVATVVVAPFVLFALEGRPPEVTALSGVALPLLLGILDTGDVLAVLSTSALTTFAAMFVLSAALVCTGAPLIPLSCAATLGGTSR